jgi:hypothetical protein
MPDPGRSPTVAGHHVLLDLVAQEGPSHARVAPQLAELRRLVHDELLRLRKALPGNDHREGR